VQHCALRLRLIRPISYASLSQVTKIVLGSLNDENKALHFLGKFRARSQTSPPTRVALLLRRQHMHLTCITRHTKQEVTNKTRLLGISTMPTPKELRHNACPRPLLTVVGFGKRLAGRKPTLRVLSYSRSYPKSVAIASSIACLDINRSSQFDRRSRYSDGFDSTFRWS
jgi:hypothetical protein